MKKSIILFLCLLIIPSVWAVVGISNNTISFEASFHKVEKEILSQFEPAFILKKTGKRLNLLQKSKLSLQRMLIKRELRKLKRKIEKYQNEDCDLIILKNGDEVEAKITEINTNEIKYKRCNNLDGPTISMSKSEIFMIKYKNGEKEIIESTTASDSPSNTYTTDVEKFNAGTYIFGFLMGLLIWPLGWLFMFIYPKKSAKRRSFISGWSTGVLIWAIIVGISA